MRRPKRGARGLFNLLTWTGIQIWFHLLLMERI
jgi:hypothetical protein